MEIYINLIPEYKKKGIIKNNRLKLVLRLGWAAFMILVVFFGLLWCLDKTLEFNLQTASLTQGSGDVAQYAKIKRFDDEFENINRSALGVIAIKNDQLYWSDLFGMLSEKMPDGVKISDLITNNYVVSLAGNADSRDDLISFKDNLGKDDCFSDINLPLSNLVESENVSFQMDFKVKEECIKKR